MFVAVLASNDVPKDCSMCNFDERMRRKVRGLDFSFFMAISAPEAGEAELRTLCDWGNWVCVSSIWVRSLHSSIDFSIPRSFHGMTVRLALYRLVFEAYLTASVRQRPSKTKSRRGTANDGKSFLDYAQRGGSTFKDALGRGT